MAVAAEVGKMKARTVLVGGWVGLGWVGLRGGWVGVYVPVVVTAPPLDNNPPPPPPILLATPVYAGRRCMVVLWVGGWVGGLKVRMW